MTTFIEGFDNYITRKNDQLFDGSNEFRFVSANIPNLHVNEDPIPDWHRIDAWEIEDAYKTINQLGGRMTRCYTLSITGGIRPGNRAAHIEGLGQYNEELFRDYDLMLALAHKYQVRLLVPFIDHWDWFGGVKHFAALRGKSAEEFYTDPQVIADFKEVISYVMNRKNTYTGITYKEDKAILAWETGNELDSPDSWIQEIIAHIKSENPKQLICDGNYGVSEASLHNPDIDIVSNHYYIDRGVDFIARTTSDRARSKGKKAFIVGEFGHAEPSVVKELLEEVVNNGSTGALLWSLRYHNKDGGFYFQGDKDDTMGHVYFWPESPVRAGGTAVPKIGYVREYAHKITNQEMPQLPVPEAPVLLPITSTDHIAWRGSVGARSYIVERSSDEGITWETIAQDVVEYDIPYKPFSDRPALAAKYHYRMRAVNESGISEASNVESIIFETSATV